MNNFCAHDLTFIYSLHGKSGKQGSDIGNYLKLASSSDSVNCKRQNIGRVCGVLSVQSSKCRVNDKCSADQAS